MSSSDPQSPAAPGSAQPPSTRPPSTQEIPVVQPPAGATATQQLPPHPGATTPAPVEPVETLAPTGPVDFVPGLPGIGTPPPPPPVRPTPVPHDEAGPPADAGSTAQAAPHGAAAPAPENPAGPVWPETLESPAVADRPAKRRATWDRPALLGLGLTVVSLALLEIGLTMRGEEVESYWQRIPLWSAFATACVLLGLVAFAAFFPAGNRLRSGPAWRVAAAGLVGLAVFWLLVVLPVVDSDRGFVLTAALAALGGALWIGPRSRKD
ncbi:hypothetical protein [Blastococcus haudaquaticus]|uniref:Uncharacterized protein n=1 Tax=Blastococcus haudaquaticus TaxID=1938745 RepID=A0A286GJL9_9ACTN|nr:hypothetical protein [Blastococcus haudaquaticus]SOD95718.1 hypothetical protein SAMN06272739_1315 [Blastococcus haudaquaticus]